MHTHQCCHAAHLPAAGVRCGCRGHAHEAAAPAPPQLAEPRAGRGAITPRFSRVLSLLPRQVPAVATASHQQAAHSSGCDDGQRGAARCQARNCSAAEITGAIAVGVACRGLLERLPAGLHRQ